MNRNQWIQTLMGILLDAVRAAFARRSRSHSGDLQPPPPLDLSYEDKLITGGLSGPINYDETVGKQTQLPGMVLTEVPDIAVPEIPSDETGFIPRSIAATMRLSNLVVVEGSWEHTIVPELFCKHAREPKAPNVGLFFRPYEGLEWQCLACRAEKGPVQAYGEDLTGPFMVVTRGEPRQ